MNVPVQSVSAPPGPRGLPVIGSLASYYLDPLGFVRKTADRYGDVVLIHVAGLPFYQLNNPDHIHTVLVTKSKDFAKGALGPERRLLLGKGLATAEGDFWLRQRRLSQPSFHRERIVAYGDMIAEHAARRIGDWPVGTTIDLHAHLMRLALELVSKALFGADMADKAIEVGERLEVLMGFFASQANFTLRLLPKNTPTPGRMRFRKAVTELDCIIHDMIARRSRDGGNGEDLLSTLIAARDEDNSQMTERQLRDEVMTLFLAGHETTALALSWTFALIARHPAVESRLAGEIDAVLGNRTPRAADVPQLRYAEQVLKESMRMYPPAWIIARQALRDVEIGGYRIPAKAFVTMSQWVMHRDPRYFDEPERFNPDRWEGDLEKRLPKFVYFPFGGGQRVCIGANLAMMEAVLLLSMITQRFRFRPAPNAQFRLDPSLSLRPKGGICGILELRAQRRNEALPRPASADARH